MMDIKGLLRVHGSRESIHRLADAAGLKRYGDRIQCPFEGCVDQGADRRCNLSVFDGDDCVAKVRCHRCGSRGDYVNMFAAINSCTTSEAIASLNGIYISPVRPQPPRPMQETRPKLTPSEVLGIWESLQSDDDAGRSYLASRLLHGCKLVRFATEQSSPAVSSHAARGRRIAMLLSDMAGHPRGMQLRLARAKVGDEPSQLTLKGSVVRGMFFGNPWLIRDAPLVIVAEGMADTMALNLWAPRALVVGAAGKDLLPSLGASIQSAGVGIYGKTFALCPQNDRNDGSLNAFSSLEAILAARGARIVWCPTPKKYKDIAEWRAAQANAVWFPEKLKIPLLKSAAAERWRNVNAD